MKPSPTYRAHRYDEHLVLRVPPLLWLVMVILVRHFLLVLLTFIPRTGDAMTYLRDLVDPLFLISDLPAAVVLFAGVRRRPGAPDWIRNLWSKGRTLLSASALLYLAILIVNLAASGRHIDRAINEAVIFSVLLHLLIITYLARSRLVRDVFRQFP